MQRPLPTLLSARAETHEDEVVAMIDIIAKALARNPTVDTQQLTDDLVRGALDCPSAKAGIVLLMAETEIARRRSKPLVGGLRSPSQSS
jgi:hypothetical protein